MMEARIRRAAASDEAGATAIEVRHERRYKHIAKWLFPLRSFTGRTNRINDSSDSCHNCDQGVSY